MKRVYVLALIFTILAVSATATIMATSEHMRDLGHGFYAELTWDGPADFDLIVTTPEGERIFYANPGGALVTDASDFCNGNTESAIERVEFPAEQAMQGEYFITVNYALACEDAPQVVAWRLVVSVNGELVEHSGELAPGEVLPVGRFVSG